MRAVQVDFPFGPGGSDAHLGQAAVSFHDLGGAGNLPPAIRLCDCGFHKCSLLNFTKAPFPQRRASEFVGQLAKSRVSG